MSSARQSSGWYFLREQNENLVSRRILAVTKRYWSEENDFQHLLYAAKCQHETYHRIVCIPLLCHALHALSPSLRVLPFPGLQTTVGPVLTFQLAAPSPLVWSLILSSPSELPAIAAPSLHGTARK